MESGFWDKEEFEDIVAKALISMYETDLFQKLPKGSGEKGRWVLPEMAKTSASDLVRVKQVGPYFPPSDREILADEYWYDIDGLPLSATFAFIPPPRPDDYVAGYLDIFHAIRVDEVPSNTRFVPCTNVVAKYKFNMFYPQLNGGIEAYSTFFKVLSNGKIITAIGSPKEISFSSNATLQVYADRKSLWNVEAVESNARATFGVHEEQVKSLFYARELPQTSTGRKRPILHWVSSHMRRMRSGVEVDVAEHLRGIMEFEMNGTLFRITQPRKEPCPANAK